MMQRSRDNFHKLRTAELCKKEMANVQTTVPEEMLPIERSSATAQEIRRDTAMQIISQICIVQLIMLNDSKATDAVCERHCLHPAQHFFQKKVLNTLRQTVEREYIYHISDIFGIHLLIFSVSSMPYLFGPFRCTHLTEHSARAILKQHGIKKIDSKTLQYYCDSFPLIGEAESLKNVSAFIYSVDPGEPGKTVKRITGMETHQDETRSSEADRPDYNVKLEYRYALEQQFIEDIKSGNTHSALTTISYIEQDVAYLKRLGSTLENERIGAAITRTTVRHAAMQAGLPALIVDKLSSKNTVQVQHANTREDVLLARDNMIRDFCKAIREIRQNKYSALAQSVLYCLNHEYSHNIDLSELAEDLSISKDRLIKIFKRETGSTPAAYLTKIRMQNAALLLINGTMAISEVSNAVGISDSNYFVKLFKKEFGETPTMYRKRYTT